MGDKIPLTLSIRRPVYNWLIKSGGWTSDEVAEALFSTRMEKEIFRTNVYKKRADVTLSLEDAAKFAELLHRPLSALFLSKPPKERPLPKDYRGCRRLPDND